MSSKKFSENLKIHIFDYQYRFTLFISNSNKLSIMDTKISKDSQCIYCNLPNDQLTDQELNNIESKLYPHGASVSGFLSTGEKLRDVIEKDKKTLRLYG